MSENAAVGKLKAKFSGSVLDVAEFVISSYSIHYTKLYESLFWYIPADTPLGKCYLVFTEEVPENK